MKKLIAWIQRDKSLFASVHTVFYHTYSQYFKKILAKRTRDRPERYRVVDQDDSKDEKSEEPVGVEYFGYDPEEVKRHTLGKRYRKREKEEAKKEGQQKD